MYGFASEIFAGKEEKRRNPDGFQAFLTQSRGNFWREDVRGDLFRGSLENAPVKNGGTIDFSGLDTSKLAQAAKKQKAKADVISMEWKNDRLELVDSDKKSIGYVKKADLIGISAVKDVKCYALDGTEIGTIKITPGTDAVVDENSFPAATA